MPMAAFNGGVVVLPDMSVLDERLLPEYLLPALIDMILAHGLDAWLFRATDDLTVLCVVEEPKDVVAIERTREFRGRYHVLGGAISPIDGIGPDDLRIRELMPRLADGVGHRGDPRDRPQPRGRGDGDLPHPAAASRWAYGSPGLRAGCRSGGDLEYADEVTLGRAFEGRRAR